MKIDWIDVWLSDYDTALNDRVREAYLAAYAVLEKAHLTRRKTCEGYVSEVTSEEEFADAHAELTYEDFRWNEQTQALATMALTMIASTNKSSIDQLKGLFDKSFPRDPKGYAGPSELHRRIAEYKLRFGVDLEGHLFRDDTGSGVS